MADLQLVTVHHVPIILLDQRNWQFLQKVSYLVHFDGFQIKHVF